MTYYARNNGTSSSGTFGACAATCQTVSVSMINDTAWTACAGLPCPLTGSETPGQQFQIQFTLSVGSSVSGTVIVYIDNVDVVGANGIVAGANLFLVNYATQQLFDVSAYTNSSLRINYDTSFNCGAYGFTQASSTVCLATAIAVPDFNISLTNATLITVNIGGSVPYTRTIIPQPNLLNGTIPADQYVYLDTPNACPSLCSYQLTVNDVTGDYTTGTQAFVEQGHYVITSAPLDAQPVIAMTMQPGIYNLTLISADAQHSITEPLSLTATNSAPSIIVQNGSNPVTIGPFQQFTGSATWDCDTGGITSTITDSLGTMTHEVFDLYRTNTTFPGSALIATHASSTTGGPGFSVSYDFRNSTIGTKNLNASTANEYTVGWMLTTPQGLQSFGRYPVTLSSSCIDLPNLAGASGAFNVPIAVLGLSQIFQTSNAYEEIFAIIIIVATAGIVAARFAHIVMLVIGGEVGLLGAMTWLPVGPAAILCPIFLFIGALGILSNRARKPIT